MPQGKKRPRTYDPKKIQAAVLAQFSAVREAVRDLTPEQLAGSTYLGDWTVRDLVVHIDMGVRAVVRHLDDTAPAEVELTLLEWPLRTARFADDLARFVPELAERAPEDLDELFAGTTAALTERLAAADPHRLLATRVGVMNLNDFMVTRTIELIVHTDDLNRAAGLDIPLDRQTLAACTRVLADAFAAKAPGGATELRIPPYAVVQCVEGPRHTRGTPPNVVETDPLTWVRLATGRTDWATARDEAKVHASGERADLAGLLPVMS
ncbi:maleylpyruvate isomerase family mycothiol-dependent enzyme [Streptomyces boluensis]|uniref:Maleylpyruvate isomerase family mycothiol-dependent enzyme n=1 Tax=Streptomyces boluensis TaxID=1775135 RepID=A0A964UR62_9ACTN|nr:maleylpyruvate isomerase family mycothiol-dependent enzyme [Streptomyces boluensis]NBE53924.1 maleylpyruvate isomerase family mycothiol-dependent enzyme [Streptomyces boluensis]